MARKKTKKRASKACIHASGKKKGKLKKGWRFGKGGRCVRSKK